MALTVNSAFDRFLSDTVNLDRAMTDKARSSRDWLVDQMGGLPDNVEDFPALYTDKHIHYGSFARRTKIRELDDLDMIVCLSALGCTYFDSATEVTINCPEGIALRGLCNEGTNELNSRKVINKFVNHLNEIPQYSKADIGRNGSAAVLNLTSYTWSFDIVPGFFTVPNTAGKTFYVIPNGQGHWMLTDPRLDQNRVSSINQDHNGIVLAIIRLLKYWNRRATMPSARSYLLECLVLNYFAKKMSPGSKYVDVEFGPLLEHVYRAILSPVLDPKGIQDDINQSSTEERYKISERALLDSQKARKARRAEVDEDHEKSIGIWGEIFGDAFPGYG